MSGLHLPDPLISNVHICEASQQAELNNKYVSQLLLRMTNVYTLDSVSMLSRSVTHLLGKNPIRWFSHSRSHLQPWDILINSKASLLNQIKLITTPNKEYVNCKVCLNCVDHSLHYKHTHHHHTIIATRATIITTTTRATITTIIITIIYDNNMSVIINYMAPLLIISLATNAKFYCRLKD